MTRQEQAHSTTGAGLIGLGAAVIESNSQPLFRIKERIMVRFFDSARVTVFAVALLSAMPAAHAACPDMLNDFNRALQSRNLAEVLRAEAAIALDAQCGNWLGEVKRRRAELQVRLAERLAAQDAEYEALLVAADEADIFWRAAAVLGDWRSKNRRFVEAAIAYQRALELIDNTTKTPNAPDPKITKEIFDKAVHARLLAANGNGAGQMAAFVPTPKNTRSGEMAGTFAREYRGFKPTAVPLPITFDTDSTRFTAVGAASAAEFLKALVEQEPPVVTIVGHTDDRGTHAHNMELSGNRANAVAKYLKDNGVKARIVTVAKGKTEPLALPHPEDFTRDDILALNRRVEWKRN